jgi:peptidoglycan/LPS O-acetylase OafA/YrhL
MILFVTTYLIWDFTSNGIITRNFSRTNYGALEILEVKYILLALVSLGVLILVNSSNFIQNILNSRMFQFLGKISYSLYLVHLILLVTFGSKIFLFFNSVFSYSYLLTILFTLVFITALTITVSFAFCKLVDEYGIKLSNGVYKVLEKL